MDPSLLAQQKAFKARAMAQPIIEKKKPTQSSSSASKPAAPRPKVAHRKLFQQRDSGTTGSSGSGKKPQLFRLIHTVVEVLKKAECAVTINDLSSQTGIDIMGDPKLYQALKENGKLIYDPTDNSLTFKPMYNVRNKDALWELLKEHEVGGFGGIPCKDLQESYAAINDDIGKLVEEHKGIVLERNDNHKKVLFYNDPRYNLDLDDEFRKLWQEISLPQECDIESYLDRVGLAKMKTHNEDKKKFMGQKKKKRNMRKNIRMQNVHVDLDMGEFEKK
eukprot:Nk52_evm87s1073 gene=Nk52_evmTU87s1073